MGFMSETPKNSSDKTALFLAGGLALLVLLLAGVLGWKEILPPERYLGPFGLGHRGIRGGRLEDRWKRILWEGSILK